jgi:hypothetical protein
MRTCNYAEKIPHWRVGVLGAGRARLSRFAWLGLGSTEKGKTAVGPFYGIGLHWIDVIAL